MLDDTAVRGHLRESVRSPGGEAEVKSATLSVRCNHESAHRSTVTTLVRGSSGRAGGDEALDVAARAELGEATEREDGGEGGDNSEGHAGADPAGLELYAGSLSQSVEAWLGADRQTPGKEDEQA